MRMDGCRWQEDAGRAQADQPGPQDYAPAPPRPGPAFTITGKPATGSAAAATVPGPGEYCLPAAVGGGPAFTLGSRLPAGPATAAAEAPGPAEYALQVRARTSRMLSAPAWFSQPHGSREQRAAAAAWHMHASCRTSARARRSPSPPSPRAPPPNAAACPGRGSTTPATPRSAGAPLTPSASAWTETRATPRPRPGLPSTLCPRSVRAPRSRWPAGPVAACWMAGVQPRFCCTAAVCCMQGSCPRLCCLEPGDAVPLAGELVGEDWERLATRIW